jgi:hypothetical protein
MRMANRSETVGLLSTAAASASACTKTDPFGEKRGPEAESVKPSAAVHLCPPSVVSQFELSSNVRICAFGA